MALRPAALASLLDADAQAAAEQQQQLQQQDEGDEEQLQAGAWLAAVVENRAQEVRR